MCSRMSSHCTGSVHIGQYLLSSIMLIEPVLIELLRGFVTQGLVRPHLLVDLVPGEESSLEPADTGG